MSICLTIELNSNLNWGDMKIKSTDSSFHKIVSFDELLFIKERSIFYSIIQILFFEHNFEVFLSPSLKCTHEFIINPIRPSCWYFFDLSFLPEAQDCQNHRLLHLFSLIPDRFYIANCYHQNLCLCSRFLNDRVLSFNSTNNIIVKDAILSKETSTCKDICKLVESHLPRRNPMRVDDWVVGVLDSCFDHVPTELRFPDSPENGLKEKDFCSLHDWSFTALGRDRDELLRLAFRVFSEFGLLDKLNIPEDRFKIFLLAIYTNYFDNPYHNFCHVIDVLQCCFFLLKEKASINLPALLGPVHLFALLLGCLCHDLGHPSFGNSFLKDSQHPLSILFNDNSVLENYHALVLFSILRCPVYDWTNNLSTDSKKEFRQCILGCIIGTDMSTHFDFIKRFESDFPNLSDSTAFLTNEQKVLLSVALIKCSDISNVIRPFFIAKRWGVALLNEFLLQGDYEKLLGYDLGPLNDRNSLKTGSAQFRFLTVVAAPLYRSVASKIAGLDCFEEWIEDNSKNWEEFDDQSVQFEQ